MMSDDDLGLGDGFGSEPGPCPTAEEISAYVSIQLPVDRLVEIRSHIRVCGTCDEVLQRLAAVDAESGRAEGREGTRRPLWQRAVLHPAMGYGLALCLAVWMLARPDAVSPPAQIVSMDWSAVKTIDLNTVRGERGPIEMGPADQRVLLGFFVPITPSRTYTAALDGSPPRAIESYDGRGNFDVLCNRAQVLPGAHRLVVRESETGAEFGFEFSFP